ncbi:CPBP family intramembrane metalloprotease domain-containing protein, partial [filamentous cyanobacterium CCP3]
MLLAPGPVLDLIAWRLAEAFAAGLSWSMGLLGLGAIALYGLLALPAGLWTGFLVRQSVALSPLDLGLDMLRRFIAPALVEETMFRVVLLPHPAEG